MSDLLIDGRRLELQATPPTAAGRPTVVFLHEGLGCAASWRTFPTTLAARTGCGTVVYSRWGYGASEHRPAPWPLDFLDHEAEVVLPAVLDACGVASAVLFGHSDGGTIALLAAASRPGRVTAVFTEAAHVMVEDVTLDGLRQLRRRFDSGDLRAGLQRLHGDRADDVFNGWAGVWQQPAFRAWDVRARLARVACPVLAAQGDGDEYGSPAQLEAIASGVCGPSSTWLIPGCGHTPHRERPADVLDRAAAFVDALASSLPARVFFANHHAPR